MSGALTACGHSDLPQKMTIKGEVEGQVDPLWGQKKITFESWARFRDWCHFPTILIPKQSSAGRETGRKGEALTEQLIKSAG